MLLAWENEAFLALKEDGGKDKFDIVVPSLSILAEPPVAVVDKNAERKGNSEIATEYLKHLYSKEGQEIAAKNFYRPRDAEVAAKYEKQFPKLDLVTIDKDFGGWKTAQPKFSMMAACSTRFIRRNKPNEDAARAASQVWPNSPD